MTDTGSCIYMTDMTGRQENDRVTGKETIFNNYQT